MGTEFSLPNAVPTQVLESLPKFVDKSPNSNFEQPIFILSAGWRSGSTLLQRMLVEQDELLMWGEPFHRSNIIESMLQQLVPLQQGWPPQEYYLDNCENLSEQWIANTWPALPNLRRAHLEYFHSLFEKPLKEFNKSQWGIKEVRWGKDHVLYLKWLYPKAKFIFLIRNPYDAYTSFFDYPKTAFLKWPNQPILTARNFAKMWRTRVREFQELSAADIGLIIKYEDLKSEEVCEKLSRYLGFEVINPKSLSKLVKPSNNSTNNVKSALYLPKIEKWQLEMFLKNAEKQFHYR